MRIQNFFIYTVIMFCVFSSCGYTSDSTDSLVQLSYDKKYNVLLIRFFESARYIQKIDLDLHQDTLFVKKVSRKMIFGKKKIMNTSQWTIKLQSNVKCIKLDNKLFDLSEIDEYSQEELIKNNYSVITVFPKKFPCVIE